MRIILACIVGGAAARHEFLRHMQRVWVARVAIGISIFLLLVADNPMITYMAAAGFGYTLADGGWATVNNTSGSSSSNSSSSPGGWLLLNHQRTVAGK